MKTENMSNSFRLFSVIPNLRMDSAFNVQTPVAYVTIGTYCFWIISIKHFSDRKFPLVKTAPQNLRLLLSAQVAKVFPASIQHPDVLYNYQPT